MNYKKEILIEEDLNDYTIIGIYGCNINPGEGRIRNYPNTDEWQAGMLVVFSGPTQSGGYQKEQLFFSSGDTQAVYVRLKWGNTWAVWKKFLDE